MILIRADANEKVGTGHMMRCLAIARAVRQRGQQVCFITADDRGTPLLKDKGQDYRVLHSDFRNMEAELPELVRIVAEYKPDFLLADSYHITSRYLREIRQTVPVGILDDMVRTDLSADLLINYNIFADASLYGTAAGRTGEASVGSQPRMGEAGEASAGSQPGVGRTGEASVGSQPRMGEAGEASAGCQLGVGEAGEAGVGYLLGTDYVPLRSEFEGIEYFVREKAETVLVTTGGSDPYNLAGQLLKKALSDPRTAALRYLVVSGAYNVHQPELRAIESAHANVRICCNVSNMSGLMQESDIAVSAGGSTMYELSAVGVPVICFSFVDNQERIVKGFADKKLACFGGDYLRQGEAMLDQVVSHMGSLAEDFALRRSLSERLRKVVDGRGAMRIAERLCAR